MIIVLHLETENQRMTSVLKEDLEFTNMVVNSGQMKKTILDNGLTVITKHKPGESVVIEVTAKVGSNYESDKEAGISHFIEHMLFTGTKKRPSSRDISSEIDRLGGEFNAFTCNERTSFYIVVPKKHFDVALDVIADMLQNTTFKQEYFEKEKKVVLDEFDIHEDNPRSYQFELFNRALFQESTAGRPVIGYKESVSNLEREDLINYYKKHYFPKNMIVVVSGHIEDVEEKIKNAFQNLPENKEIKRPIIKEEIYNKIRNNTKKKEVMHSYTVIGYRTCNRKNKDSYVLDVIKVILGGGMSSRLFEEIRVKRGLAYNVGAEYEADTDYGIFAAYLSTDKQHLETAKEIVLKEYQLNNLTDKEIKDAKTFLEGKFILDMDDPQKLADRISDFETTSDSALILEYLKNINKVTKEDIQKVIKKYFTKNHTIALIEQK